MVALFYPFYFRGACHLLPAPSHERFRFFWGGLSIKVEFSIGASDEGGYWIVSEDQFP